MCNRGKREGSLCRTGGDIQGNWWAAERLPCEAANAWLAGAHVKRGHRSSHARQLDVTEGAPGRQLHVVCGYPGGAVERS